MQEVFVYLQVLCVQKVFTDVHIHFLPPGHTHGNLDQKYAVISQKIYAEDLLSPLAVMKYVQSLFPGQGPTSDHHLLEDVADFKRYIKGCNYHLLGHGSYPSRDGRELRSLRHFHITAEGILYAEEDEASSTILGEWDSPDVNHPKPVRLLKPGAAFPSSLHPVAINRVPNLEAVKAKTEAVFNGPVARLIAGATNEGTHAGRAAEKAAEFKTSSGWWHDKFFPEQQRLWEGLPAEQLTQPPVDPLRSCSLLAPAIDRSAADVQNARAIMAAFKGGPIPPCLPAHLAQQLQKLLQEETDYDLGVGRSSSRLYLTTDDPLAAKPPGREDYNPFLHAQVGDLAVVFVDVPEKPWELAEILKLFPAEPPAIADTSEDEDSPDVPEPIDAAAPPAEQPVQMASVRFLCPAGLQKKYTANSSPVWPDDWINRKLVSIELRSGGGRKADITYWDQDVELDTIQYSTYRLASGHVSVSETMNKRKRSVQKAVADIVTLHRAGGRAATPAVLAQPEAIFAMGGEEIDDDDE